MKRCDSLTAAMFVGSALALSAWANASSAAVMANLQSHYPFEGSGQTVTDNFGSNNGVFGPTSAVEPTRDPTRVAGFLGNALDFDGSVGNEKFVTLVASDTYLTGADAPFSYAAWVNIDTFNDGRLSTFDL